MTPANPPRPFMRPLSVERWTLIEEIFHQARSHAGAAREEVLQRLCAGDAALLAETRALLTADNQSTVQQLKTKAPAPDLAGRRAGNYQLDSLLGTGGMGSVYLAHRCDGQFDRQVALKLLGAHLRSEFFTGRFGVERQLLATLDHPNITRLLDSGVSAEGDPYLVLEYVDGKPIDEYCDQRRLGIRARIQLFLHLCAAVEYAHRQQVIHRDLKPSNILVSADGTAKLLDFGTAKLVEAADSNTTATRFRMLTPQYASPEQLRGDPLTPATDVYSLGIILYGLVAGAWPFGDPQSVVSGLERAVRDVEARHPAEVADDEAAGRRGVSKATLVDVLKGDLWKVIHKAIEAEPDRRYPSVKEFSKDLERFLEGSTVRARPQTITYRSAKFVRRHATAAAITVALIAIVIAGLFAAWGYWRSLPASLAVLPFQNLSGDGGGQYFSDGLTSEITDAVAHIHSINVIASASAFEAQKGSNADAPGIGRKLGVTNVLEGSIERNGDRVKLAARLDRTSDGKQIWSKTYDRPIAELRAIESDLAAGIAQMMNASIELPSPAKHVVSNRDAIDAYMRAIYEMDRFTRESMEHAVADLKRAIELDAEYAAAYAALGAARLNQNNLERNYHAGISADEIVKIASGYYRKALELDPDLATPRVNLAQLALQYSWDWAAAEREYRTTLARGQNPAANMNFAYLLIYQGRFAEADDHLRLAQQQNPYATVAIRQAIQARLWENRFTQAIELARPLVARDPGNPVNRNLMDAALYYSGQADQALADLRKLELKIPSAKFAEAQILACLGRRDEAMALMQPFEANYPANGSAAIGYAQFYGCLGDEAATVAWLNKSADAHEAGILAIGVGPGFDRVRRSVGFQAVMKRIGLAH